MASIFGMGMYWIDGSGLGLGRASFLEPENQEAAAVKHITQCDWSQVPHLDEAAKLQLCLRDGLFFETAEFGKSQLQDLGDFSGGGAGVDGEASGVAEGIGLGVDGVGEAAVLADGLEEA